MRATLYLLEPLLGASLCLLLVFFYRRWQKLHERERFVLGMKQVATPKRMSPEEIARLRLLRARWWLVWRWLPDLWGGAPQVRGTPTASRR